MTFIRSSAALLTVALLAATACQTDLTGMNKNPNSPTVAPASALFTNATATTVGRFNGSFQTLSMTSLFAEHIAQVQYVDEDRGHIRVETIDGLFTAVYTSELEDYEKVAAIGAAANSPNTVGPARIMQTWVYQNLTDLWGDIPYSEALQGDLGGPQKPAYDPQQSIYTGMLAALTTASATMTPGSNDVGIGPADPIYQGNIAKWQRFSNSLRARMALRINKADPAKSATELAAAIAAPGGLMTSNADNAQLAWPGDGVFDNPWADNFATRDDHRMSKTLMDTLIALQDPRVPIYAQPTKADTTVYAGLQNGLDNVLVVPFFNTTSRPGLIFYPGVTAYGTYGTVAGKSTPSNLMVYAEVEFILAEAANRGIAGVAGAAGHYNAGVSASILQWGGTQAQADAYLLRPGVAYVAGATGLKQIGLQKWIALFTQGTEAWSEWRRTGNPATVVIGPQHYADVPAIPRRLPYPSNEQSVNAASLAAAIARQGPDTYMTKMWWDQ